MSIKSIPYFVFFSFCLLCQNRSIGQQYNFQTLSISEGLGQSQVFAILEDSKGRLWLGTQGGGVNIYDGRSFIAYTNRDSLNSNFVFSLHEDSEKNVWIGTKKGLSIFRSNKIEDLTSLGIPQISINSINSDKEGRIWIGTAKGIYQYKNGKIVNYSRKVGLPSSWIYTIEVQQNGTVWIGSSVGLWRIVEDNIDYYSTENWLPGNDVTAIMEDDLKRIWIAVYGKGIYQFKGREFTPLPHKQRFNSLNFQSLKEVNQGVFWMGTQDKGILVWNESDSTLVNLTENDGLGKNDARAICKDRWGEVWVGTSGGGISRYFGQQFMHYNSKDGLTEDFIYAIEEDSVGQIWFSQYNKGVAIHANNIFKDFEMDSFPQGFITKSIYNDNKNNLWIGTERNGIFISNPDTVINLPISNDFPFRAIRKIIQDEEGNYLIATLGSGLFELKRDTSSSTGFSVENYLISDGLPDNRLNSLHKDSLDRIWIATRWNGIACWKDGRVLFQFGTSDGLPSREIRAMEEDSIGNLWFGTSSGICKINIYSDSMFVSGKEDSQKLRYQNIYLLKFDRDNQLWIGSQSGVEKAILDAEGRIIESQFFGREEGFAGIETCQNSVLEDSKGNLWFGTMNGLTKYIPGALLKNDVPPVIELQEIRLFYKNLKATTYSDNLDKNGKVNQKIIFAPKDNHLSFKFLGINLPNPNKVKYQWILEGAEEEWSPPSSQNEVMYTGLDFGSYNFKVKACNESEVWSEPISFSFYIEPHIWETLPFKVIMIATGLILIFSIFRIRLNQVKEKANQEKEKIQMEKNLLELEQKALQLQMNPHFIFNALNSIQSHISSKDPKTARFQLAKFSKLMRAILENSRTNKISLETEIETLENYLALENFSRGNTFDYQFIYSDELELEELFIPPMIIQPFIENSIIHGLAHLNDRRGLIQVAFELNESFLHVSVKDNGIGRAAAKVLKSQRNEQHRSIALEVTQERLENLQTDKAKDFEGMEILDLVLSDGTIEGTEVKISIPLL